MQVRKQQLELDIEQQTSSKWGKEYVKAAYCHTAYLVHHAKCQAGGSTSCNQYSGRNINNLRYADDTTRMAENKEEVKNLLKKVKEESEKVGLKLNIQKMEIMASGPTTLWEIDGETVEQCQTFFLGSKITAEGDCSH